MQEKLCKSHIYVCPVSHIPVMISRRQCVQPSQLRMMRRQCRERGVCMANLSTLECAASPADAEIKIQLALLNVRSLSNKTFILRDLYVSCELDLMFLTETWLRVIRRPSLNSAPLIAAFSAPPDCVGEEEGLPHFLKTLSNVKRFLTTLPTLVLNCNFLLLTNLLLF